MAISTVLTQPRIALKGETAGTSAEDRTWFSNLQDDEIADQLDEEPLPVKKCGRLRKRLHTELLTESVVNIPKKRGRLKKLCATINTECTELTEPPKRILRKRTVF